MIVVFATVVAVGVLAAAADEMLPDGSRFHSIFKQPLPPEEFARIAENRERLKRMPRHMWMDWLPQIQNSSSSFPDIPMDKPSTRSKAKQGGRRTTRPSQTEQPQKPGRPRSVEDDIRARRQFTRDETIPKFAQGMDEESIFDEDPRDYDEIDPGERLLS